MTKEKISGIYKIENLTNGKIYIGSSQDIDERWKKHISLLKKGKHQNTHLQNAWNKDGENNFCFSILERCERSMLLEREQYYIDLTKCYNRDIGYNIMISTTMSEFSDEVKNKISNTLKGKYCGENSSNAICTEEQIKNIIDDLINTNLTGSEIAKKHNVPRSVVCNVLSKSTWKHLTKDIVFHKREIDRSNAIINNESIKDVINDLLDCKTNAEIAQKYGVKNKTISDIRCHKTWKKYTDGYVFPKVDGLRRGKNNNKSKLNTNDVIQIKNELKNGSSMTSLAKSYGVSVQAIKNIKQGKSYAYI